MFYEYSNKRSALAAQIELPLGQIEIRSCRCLEKKENN